MTITAETRLLGLIGWPVDHSLSPAMHNAAAAALHMDLAYLPLPVPPDQVEEALRGLPALGFLGANVTVPHKQAVMPFLQAIDPAARAIGAVNTIKVMQRDALDRVADGRPQTADRENLQSPVSGLSGFNTDWSGFLADLEAYEISVADRDCLVLGAGGSARAVVYGLARSGARVTVFARRPAQAEGLVHDLRAHLQGVTLRAASWTELEEAQEAQAPLVVNTTPVGMHPDVDGSPWPRELLLPQKADVYDVIYNPAETELMRRARATGCRAYNGLGMLLQQGALAFEIWTGVKPPLEVMATALRENGVA